MDHITPEYKNEGIICPRCHRYEFIEKIDTKVKCQKKGKESKTDWFVCDNCMPDEGKSPGRLILVLVTNKEKSYWDEGKYIELGGKHEGVTTIFEPWQDYNTPDDELEGLS